MSDTLLNRRRDMMQIIKGYKINWYPIIQGSVTSQDMINEYGDLFQTYEDAPDVHPTGLHNPAKTSAFALDKSITTIQLGGNDRKECIVYEEGQAPIILGPYTNKTTINFVSNQTYKHVVCYNNNLGGNQSLGGVGWVINENAPTFGPARVNISVKYIHIPYNTSMAIQWGTGLVPGPVGYNNSIFYQPDWCNSGVIGMRFGKYEKIRFSKGTILNNSIYFWGQNATEMPNLTDIYVHWGLGEVPQQPGNRYTGQWKLHIPDLGNAEDNAALVAEYQSKNWGRVSGQGIFNDVEATEPQEQDSI